MARRKKEGSGPEGEPEPSLVEQLPDGSAMTVAAASEGGKELVRKIVEAKWRDADGAGPELDDADSEGILEETVAPPKKVVFRGEFFEWWTNMEALERLWSGKIGEKEKRRIVKAIRLRKDGAYPENVSLGKAYEKDVRGILKRVVSQQVGRRGKPLETF